MDCVVFVASKKEAQHNDEIVVFLYNKHIGLVFCGHVLFCLEEDGKPLLASVSSSPTSALVIVVTATILLLLATFELLHGENTGFHADKPKPDFDRRQCSAERRVRCSNSDAKYTIALGSENHGCGEQAEDGLRPQCSGNL